MLSRRGFREPQILGALPQEPKFLGFLPKTPLAAGTALTVGVMGTGFWDWGVCEVGAAAVAMP